MTGEFLRQLISASLMGTIAIIAVVIMKKILESKLSPKAHLFVWIPVILRLVFQVDFKTTVSVYNHIPEKTYEKVYMTFEKAGVTPVSTHVSISPAFFVWLIGTLLCVLIPLISYIRFLKHIKAESSEDSRFDCVAIDMGILCKMRKLPVIKICTQSMSPMVTGFLKPILLIPKWTVDVLSDEQMRIVFIHEYIHLKRGDRFVNLGLILLCAMHWFNPFVWVMASAIRKDIENVCDEQVLKTMDSNNPGVYGKTLLDLAEWSSESEPSIFVSPMASHKKTLRQRVRILMGFGKKRMGASILPLVIVMSVTLLTGAMAQDTQDVAEIISESITHESNVADAVPEFNETPSDSGIAKSSTYENSTAETGNETRQDEGATTSDDESDVVDNGGNTGINDSEKTESTDHARPLPSEDSKLPSADDNKNQNPDKEEDYSDEKVYTYSSQNATGKFSTDKKKSGFASYDGEIRIDTIGLISSDESSLHGYFNVYKDGELVGESIRAYVNSSPSAITFSDVDGDLDYSFKVKTKTID